MHVCVRECGVHVVSAEVCVDASAHACVFVVYEGMCVCGVCRHVCVCASLCVHVCVRTSASVCVHFCECASVCVCKSVCAYLCSQ